MSKACSEAAGNRTNMTIRRHLYKHALWNAGTAAPLGLALSLLTLGLLSEFHEELADPEVRALDIAVLVQMHANSSPVLTQLLLALTFIGSPLALTFVTAGTAAVLVLNRQWVALTGLVVAVVGSGILNVVLKLWFRREHPYVAWALTREPTFSFPSGHSMVSIVVFGMAAYLLCRLVLWPRDDPLAGSIS